MSIRKEAIPSESITSREASLAIEKHEKSQKTARFDFSEAKGVTLLSSDYGIIDGDQAPISNKGGLPSSSESTEPTLKSTDPIAAALSRLG
jgi:hypothetical protein